MEVVAVPVDEEESLILLSYLRETHIRACTCVIRKPLQLHVLDIIGGNF